MTPWWGSKHTSRAKNHSSRLRSTQRVPVHLYSSCGVPVPRAPIRRLSPLMCCWSCAVPWGSLTLRKALAVGILELSCSYPETSMRPPTSCACLCSHPRLPIQGSETLANWARKGGRERKRAPVEFWLQTGWRWTLLCQQLEFQGQSMSVING